MVLLHWAQLATIMVISIKSWSLLNGSLHTQCVCVVVVDAVGQVSFNTLLKPVDVLFR